MPAVAVLPLSVVDRYRRAGGWPGAPITYHGEREKGRRRERRGVLV